MYQNASDNTTKAKDVVRFDHSGIYSVGNIALNKYSIIHH